jgi:hypothetical protein
VAQRGCQELSTADRQFDVLQPIVDLHSSGEVLKGLHGELVWTGTSD